MRRDHGRFQHGRVNVAVAVDDESRASICEVVAACRAVGFEHTSTLGDVGVVTGTAVLEALPELRDVPGVIAVEVQRPYRTQSLTMRRRDRQAITAGKRSGSAA